MIVWNEEAERYLLTVNRWEEVLVWGLLAAVGAAPVVWIELFARRANLEERTCCAVVFVPFCLVAAARAIQCSRQRGWVEVPLRGGAVRWGYPGAVRQPAPVEVKMFAVLNLAGGDSTVEAILPNGAHVRALGRWRSGHTGRVLALVRQLNDLLTPSAPPAGPQAQAPTGEGRPL